MNKAVLEAAADWWVDQISGPKLNWDNGAQREGSDEDRKLGEKMWLLGNMVAVKARVGITEDQLILFRNKLMESIEKDFTRHYDWAKEYDPKRISDGGVYASFGVDYHPDSILREAADAAGISHNVFPCKSNMWVKEDEVTARCGYHAPEEKVFPE